MTRVPDWPARCPKCQNPVLSLTVAERLAECPLCGWTGFVSSPDSPQDQHSTPPAPTVPTVTGRCGGLARWATVSGPARLAHAAMMRARKALKALTGFRPPMSTQTQQASSRLINRKGGVLVMKKRHRKSRR